MKTLILKGVSVNRLLDAELEKLMNADIEFAITNNNGQFGIDNTEGYSANMNTLVFMWPEGYDNEKKEWIDKINDSANIVAEVIRPFFEWYSNDPSNENDTYMSEWRHIKNTLNHMNAFATVKYDFSYLTYFE